MTKKSKTKAAPELLFKLLGLAIKKIRRDGGTQMRANGIDPDNVAGMRDTLKAGGTLPPVIVFWDGASHWLASGFHRIEAHLAEKRGNIEAKVVDGTQRDAQLFAVGTNAEHGKQRTDADKRVAVRALFADPEWYGWSDREIARRCHVSPNFVGDRREEWDAEQERLTAHEDSEDDDGSEEAEEVPSGKPRTYRAKSGTVSTMKTESIGKTLKIRVPDAEDRAKANLQWPRTVVKLLHQCDAAGITPEDALVWGRAELERRRAAGSRRRA